MNSSNKEAYENGWFSGEQSYVSNLATLKLESNNTGLWAIGKISELFKQSKEKPTAGEFLIEFFDAEDSSSVFNQKVQEFEDAGVIPCAFSKRNFVSIKNAYVSVINFNNFVLTGNISLCTEHHDGTTENVCKVQKVTVFVPVPGFVVSQAFSAVANVKLTMNSFEVWRLAQKEWEPSAMEFNHSLRQEEDDAPKAGKRRSSKIFSFMKS
jgi:hypothetical protein